MKDIEIQYQKMLQQVEFENSLLSDFELQKEKEKKLKEKQIAWEKEALVLQTSEDFEDLWEKELKNFEFAPRKNGINI